MSDWFNSAFWSWKNLDCFEIGLLDILSGMITFSFDFYTFCQIVGFLDVENFKDSKLLFRLPKFYEMSRGLLRVR